MAAYTKPQRWKKEISKRLRGGRSSLLILDLKDGKLLDSGKQEEGKALHKLHVLGMNDDLRDRDKSSLYNLIPLHSIHF